MKYLILTTKENTKIPIIFPEFMECGDVAGAMIAIVGEFEITGMGHVSLERVQISDGNTADGLEMITHDYFNRKVTDFSIN